MSDIIRYTDSLPSRFPDRQTSRSLSRLERQTLLRANHPTLDIR